MNVKKIIVCSVTAIVLTGTAAFLTDHRRKSLDAGELDRQIAILNREHRERQRELESNLGELGSIAENAIASLEGAGDIVERTGRELQSATADLRSAKRILENIAVQIRDLQNDLDNCRSDLHRIRGLAGMEPDREIKTAP
jgi:chromosome segregation ATPase